MPLVSVTKCHATGNDFVLLDARDTADQHYGEVARIVCHRRRSMGADGLLVLSRARAPGCDVAMRVFNADGSEAETSGNGLRCVARYLFAESPLQTELCIETAAGIKQATRAGGEGPGIRVAMGVPQCIGEAGRPSGTMVVRGEPCPAFLVSMGNPHVVIFTGRDPKDMDLAVLRNQVRAEKICPSETNIEVVHIANGSARMRVLERGVGETWACGTGACAAAAAAIVSGRARSPVIVRSKGGAVQVDLAGPGETAYLTGDACIVYRTEIDIPAAPALHSAR